MNLKYYKNIFSFDLNNLKIYLILLFLILSMQKAQCIGELSEYTKWHLLSKYCGLYNCSRDIISDIQCMTYIDNLESIINKDLSLLKTQQEIKEYSKFIQHMCELSRGYFDTQKLTYGEYVSFIQRLHEKQWMYWCELKMNKFKT